MAKWLKVQLTEEENLRSRLVLADAVNEIVQRNDGSVAVFINDRWHTVHDSNETVRDYLGVVESLELGSQA